MRVRLDYTADAGTLAGSRFYLSYAGAAPTGGNCITLATDIAAAWNTHLAPQINDQYALTEIDVLDIATDSGLSGQWTGSDSGTDTSASLPGNMAVNVEFNISRRYRGGKPRMFLPSPGNDGLATINKWTPDYIAATNTAIAAFYTEIEALSIGAVGTLAHVNLSYYKGFTNITNSSGRERAVPTYRAAAVLDTVVGYATKAVVGSQRRRRTATSP
jgi:hypothetical protein